MGGAARGGGVPPKGGLQIFSFFFAFHLFPSYMLNISTMLIHSMFYKLSLAILLEFEIIISDVTLKICGMQFYGEGWYHVPENFHINCIHDI